MSLCYSLNSADTFSWNNKTQHDAGGHGECHLSLSSCHISATPRACSLCCWIECISSVAIHVRKLSAYLPLISGKAASCDGMTGSSTLEEGPGVATWPSTGGVSLSGGSSLRNTQSLCDLALPLIALKSRVPGSVWTPFVGDTVAVLCTPSWLVREVQSALLGLRGSWDGVGQGSTLAALKGASAQKTDCDGQGRAHQLLTPPAQMPPLRACGNWVI